MLGEREPFTWVYVGCILYKNMYSIKIHKKKRENQLTKIYFRIQAP